LNSLIADKKNYSCSKIFFFILIQKNLDVNLAVNNLLQRDDEGDDPTDDEDPYMHGGKLINNKKAFYFIFFVYFSRLSSNTHK